MTYFLSHFQTKLIIIVALLWSFSSCKGDKGDLGPAGPPTPVDKQLRLTFFSVLGVGRSDTVYYVMQNYHLFNFKKSDFLGVDSITFAVVGRSLSPTTSFQAQLFDVTDNEFLPGSGVDSNSTSFALVQSGNIFDSLPDKQVTLAVAFRSNTNGVGVELEQAHLFLYRN